MGLKSFSKENPLLLSPGPVLLHPQIQKNLALAMIHHRDQAFQEILLEVSKKLKLFFQTEEEVLILNATGTGAMEAALLNTLSAGEELICVGGGKFGERWRDMAQKLSLKVHFMDLDWGQALDPAELEKTLSKYPQAQALILTASETSTATSHPVEEISQVLKKHPRILFIVDAITALAAMPMKMQEWGIDVMIAGSQKSFWLPTGLSFISLSKKAWQKSLSSRLPKYYFDLNREKKAQAKGQTAFSSPVTLIRALHSSLKLLENIGLENLISQCESFKNSTLEFGKILHLQAFSSSPSSSVTALLVEEAGEIKKNLEKNHHIIVAGGQEQLKNKILRIGHLGPIKKEDFLFALKSLALELQTRSPSHFTKKQVEKACKKASEILFTASL